MIPHPGSLAVMETRPASVPAARCNFLCVAAESVTGTRSGQAERLGVDCKERSIRFAQPAPNPKVDGNHPSRRQSGPSGSIGCAKISMRKDQMPQDQMRQDTDTSNAMVRPPFAWLLALVAGIAINWLYPLPFVPASVAGAWVGTAI